MKNTPDVNAVKLEDMIRVNLEFQNNNRRLKLISYGKSEEFVRKGEILL